MYYIKLVLKGIVIGGGMILPGVSGAVLAVILGIYKQILDSIATFFKDVKKNIKLLLPVLIGLGIGLILFGKLLFFLFDNYEMQTKYIFIGLILGGIPVLYKEALEKGDKKLNIPAFLIALIVSLLLFVFGKDTFNFDFSANLNNNAIAFILLFISGFIFIAGKIIPGISSSFMLMLVGMYEFLLKYFNNPLGLSKLEYLQLFPFILGMGIGAVILVKFIRHLFDKHHLITYSIIIGFVLGSIYAIYPGFSFDLKGLLCIILFGLSFYLSYKFSLLGKK